MTVVFMDGFDVYNGTGVNAGVLARWNYMYSNGFGQTNQLVAGRFGGQAFQIGATAGAGSGYSGVRIQHDPSGSITTGTFGVAYRQAGLITSGRSNCFGILNPAAAEQCGWGTTNTGQFYLYRGGTILATSFANILVSNQWCYVELEVVIDATAGSMNLWVNGAVVCSASGVNTQGAGSGGCNGINLTTQCNLGQSWSQYDDLYATNTASRLGERRIETLRPTSDYSVGFTPNTGTGNFNKVNETLADGDTTYVSSSTIGARDLYTLSPLVSTPNVIDAVGVVTFAEKTDATTRQMYNSVQSAGTDSDGPAFNLGASYVRYDRIISTDPATGAAWTIPGVNNLLIGPKVAS